MRPAFHFDSSICSGCKTCQVACMDRNDLATGTLWRRVYEVAGGEWHRDGAAWRPDVFAYHLSLSCNHCERPICVECCPSGAIAQREDGIVLLDEETCLGCGYCSWACPYGAPQLRPDTGAMSKCDFCVEELDAGRPPACVAACPVRALDWVDVTLEEGSQPPAVQPLPDPELTRPALELEPHRDSVQACNREFDLDPRPPRGLREWSLVCFTLLIQIAAGLALWLGTARWWLFRTDESEILAELQSVGLLLVAPLTAAAIGISLFHLGRPRKMLRAIANLRSSWLSREILLVCLFFFFGLWALLPGSAVARDWMLPATGFLLIGGMARVYMLRTVPVWNRPQTPLNFLVTALLLGGVLTLALLATLRWQEYVTITWSAWVALLALELLGRSRFFAAYRRWGV